MSQQRYKVVETTWGKSGRVEKDIGSTWKPEKAAKDELRALQLKHSGRLFSLKKESK